MNIWKWFGWDTKGARTERIKDNNKHSTAQWAMTAAAAIVIVWIIWG